jgi:hypothetical protein
MSEVGPQISVTPSGASGQIVSGLLATVTIFIVLFTVELLYVTTNDARNRFQTLLDYTAGAEDMSLTIHQDASKYNDAKPIGLSMNERTGIEFGYSFYIFINPATFTNSTSFKHVFHKGYSSPWPLMAPGVFLHGDVNTMRVVMNTYKNPYTYADVKNIPVQKWCHVVLNSYKSGLDIFVNGNLANRINFTDTLPYQNFQDVIIFSNTNNNTLRGSVIPSLNGEDFILEGSFKGYLSNMVYARYALSMTEIQRLMEAGPSSKLRQKNMDKPPYLGDDWWAHSA